MSTETNTQKEYSDEEIAAMRDRQLKFYKDNIPSLKISVEYEELKTRLDKARVEGMMYKMKLAELLSPKAPEQTEPKQPK